mmetsp:Transcript_33405/g.53851  ORF Transcript_33405/g.53851 Transcript_33405/m.53851 type:complete len:280 (+) Transcript_33405:1000-1839(+)
MMGLVLYIRHVQRDVVRSLVKLFDVLSTRHLVARKTPSSFERECRIVTHNFHSKRQSCSNHPGTDMSETNYSKSLSSEFLANKHFLVLFNALGDSGVLAVLLRDNVGLYVLNALRDATGSKKKRANYELLDGISVGSWGIEDRYSHLRHLLDWNIVGSSTAAGNGTHRRLDLFNLQLVASEQDSVGFASELAISISRDLIFSFWEFLQTNRRDSVECLNVEGWPIVVACHGSLSSFLALLSFLKELRQHIDFLGAEGSFCPSNRGNPEGCTEGARWETA